MQLQNRQFRTVTNANTIAQWVDAYNNNALAGSDIQFAMGEATFSSVLYTGLETVGNGVNSYKIQAWKDIAPEFKGVFPDNIVLDNWYVYFRNANRFILINNLHFDLTDYSRYDNNEFVHGDLYHFFLNYQMGFRISHSPMCKQGEARLFRFIASSSNIFQLIPTFPRYFYSGMNVEYEDVIGMDVKPSTSQNLGTADGHVHYDGIWFDNHPMPDHKEYTSELIDHVHVIDGGAGYLFNDVVATNVVGTNARVTEVRGEINDLLIWQPDILYTVGWEVYYEGYYWTALADNENEAPDASANWEKGELAGVIIAAEMTEDPINVQGEGVGAIMQIDQVSEPWDLLYNNDKNKLDYNNITKLVDGSKIMDYNINSLTDLGPNKFTIQRIHLDYLTDTLIMQYGNTEFDTMRAALDAVYSLSFPFVYNTYIFPVLAYMIVRSDYTDLTDEEQCMIVQVRTRSTDIRETHNLAADSWARAKIAQHDQMIQQINNWLHRLQDQVDGLRMDFDLHVSNNFPSPLTIKDGINQNPHRVTKAEVGLGNVDNVAVTDMKVPSTQAANAGPTPGELRYVRIALDELDNALRSFLGNKIGNNLIPETMSVEDWVSGNFLWKTRSDSTVSTAHTQIRHIVTGDTNMIFGNSTTLSATTPTPNNTGYRWFVGLLQATDREAYGVEKS